MSKELNSPGKFFGAVAWLLFDRRRSSGLCLVFVVGSFACEYFFGVKSLFACSGAVVTIAGLFLNIKHSLNFHLKISMDAMYNKLAGAGIWGTSNVSEDQLKWAKSVMRDEVFGVSFMIVGTIIWAYGAFFMAFLQ